MFTNAGIGIVMIVSGISDTRVLRFPLPFRPNVSTPVPLSISSQEIVKGNTVTEIRNTYTDWLSDVMRVTENGDVEIDWVIGPIPVGDKVGKEIIWR